MLAVSISFFKTSKCSVTFQTRPMVTAGVVEVVVISLEDETDCQEGCDYPP